MRVLPILFNTDMVRAILDARKTVTRRPVKPQPKLYGLLEAHYDWHGIKRPYSPGDTLYVRETFKPWFGGYSYKADSKEPNMWTWKPSIHMPREAARIFLRITDVRVERLQEITEAQAIAEGVNWKDGKNVGIAEKMRRSAISRFAELWGSTVKPADLDRYGWDANPWVWVIEFERCEQPQDF